MTIEQADIVDSGAGLTRRRFLTLTGTVVGGAAALGSSRLLAAPRSAFEVLSVGYVQGSQALPNLRPLPWPLEPWSGDPGLPPRALQVVPAAGLLMGDPELSQGVVWMRVHGLYPGLEEGISWDFQSANLIVYYPSEDPIVGDVAPAIVWGARGGSWANTGAPVGFPVPLRVDGALDLVFEVAAVSGQTTRLVRYATSFTVDPIAGLPKIQRGIYLLGLAADTWTQARPLRRDRRGLANPRDLSLVVSFEPVSIEP